jgi:hypothetical protein
VLVDLEFAGTVFTPQSDSSNKPGASLMFNCLAFLESGIAAPSADPTEDGRRMATACMKKLIKLDDEEQFPPKLLILLASPEFLKDSKASKLITGVYHVFSTKVPLIGSSVAAVFYRNKIHAKGALLICLASRLIKATVAFGENANLNEKINEAITNLLVGLELKPYSQLNQPSPNNSAHIDILERRISTPLPHRLLISFFPGSGTNALESRSLTEALHERLWQEVDYQIPIVGGVSSANDRSRKRKGLQFVNREVYNDAVVSALINSGVPLGERLTNGIHWVEESAHKVTKISKSGQYIEKFEDGTPDEVINDKKRLFLFKEYHRSSDHVVAISEPSSAPRTVEALRTISTHSVLVPGWPRRRLMYEHAESAIKRSEAIMHIENPIGCLSLKCASHYNYSEVLNLDIEDGISNISKTTLKGKPYVGGFFDGEVGTDKTGRSRYGNWGVATIVFGDEITDSTLMQRGYELMRTYSAEMSGSPDIDEVISKPLDLIYDIGFPGAMVSFLQPHDHKSYILLQKARGARLSKLKGLEPLDLGSGDILARIIRGERKDHLIRDLRRVEDCQDAIKRSGVISQYIIPLKDPQGAPLAVLQVDLGSTRKILPAEGKMLDSIGAFVGAILNRVFSWQESEIVRKLDEALVMSLSAENLEDGLQAFIKQAVKAFKLEMGHVRLLGQQRNSLSLAAGVGKYYEVAIECRSVIGLYDDSPTVSAFKNVENTPTIINDTQKNSGHKKLCKKYKNHPGMKQALDQVGSYANVPIAYSKWNIGTVNLLSDKKWFFKSYHRHALEALGRRISFLIVHLGRKQKDRFLQQASPILSDIENFDETPDVLREATENFCNALGAEYAALYLEDQDEDSSLYILRAQHGWTSGDELISLAYYSKGDGWIGNEAASKVEPLYFPDLYKEYQRRAYPRAMKRYARDIFGKELSRDFTVEALALPLKVGSEALGVLTLYRRVDFTNPKRPSGFATTDTDLLKRAANSFAGLVNLVISYQNKDWDKREADHRSTINENLALQETHYAEARICKNLLDLLSAIRVDFFKLEGISLPRWVIGVEVRDNNQIARTSPLEADSKILDVAGKNTVIVEASRKSRKFYKGTLIRACIPLEASTGVVGILNVCWEGDKSQYPPLIGERGKEYLLRLGRIVGSAYKQHDLAIMNERKGIALAILNSVMLGRSHQLTRPLYSLNALSKKLQLARNENSRKRYTSDIVYTAKSIQELLDRKVTLGNKVLEGNLEPLTLYKSIGKVLNKAITKIPPKQLENLEYSLELPTNIEITGVRQIVEEIFSMLINNTLEAMKLHGKRHRLHIEAELDTKKRNVTVFIKGSGRGKIEEVKAILSKIDKEKRPPKIGGRYRLGIYFSRELLRFLRGDLNYVSNSVGEIMTLVTLPLREKEEIQ